MGTGEIKNTDDSTRNKTAADLYEVQPYYQRADQKDSMARQWWWHPPAIELSKQMTENLEKNIKRNTYQIQYFFDTYRK